jgi:hypothetical protein
MNDFQIITMIALAIIVGGYLAAKAVGYKY